MPKEKIKEKEAAEQLFIENFWDAKTIAEKLGLQESTVGRWREKGGWDVKRNNTMNNPVRMRKLIADQMMLILKGEKPNIDADALSKMFKVYEGISDKINPGIVAAILKLQDEFLLNEDHEYAVKHLEWNKKFLIHIINNYG